MKKTIIVFILIVFLGFRIHAQTTRTNKSSAKTSSSVSTGLGGSWEGNVTQDNPSSTYRVEMSLYGKVGNINYPSLGCGGNLEFIRTDGTSFWYREHIAYGKDKCIDGGLIQIRRHALGDDNNWEWRWEGGGATVRGVIRGKLNSS